MKIMGALKGKHTCICAFFLVGFGCFSNQWVVDFCENLKKLGDGDPSKKCNSAGIFFIQMGSYTVVEV